MSNKMNMLNPGLVLVTWFSRNKLHFITIFELKFKLNILNIKIVKFDTLKILTGHHKA